MGSLIKTSVAECECDLCLFAGVQVIELLQAHNNDPNAVMASVFA